MRRHLYALDALRFFSAFAVLGFHLCFYAWASDVSTVARAFDDAARYEALAPLTWFGWVGVEIFFVISGFVIANSAAAATPMAFLRGRVLRLYPAAWICASLTVLMLVALGGNAMGGLLGAYLRSMALWPHGPWIDGVYWSLAVEIAFYGLVFAVLITHGVLRLEMLPWALTALSLFYAVAHEAAAHGAPLFAPQWGALLETLSEPLLLRHGSFFAIGVWLWMVSERRLGWAGVLGALAALGLCLREIGQRAAELGAGEVSYAGGFSPIAPMLTWIAACALISVVALRPGWFSVAGARAQQTLKRVGLMTYPLFLAHSVVGAGLIRVLVSVGVNAWMALGVAIAAAFPLAYVISAAAETWVRARLAGAFGLAEARARQAPHLSFLFEPAPRRD